MSHGSTTRPRGRVLAALLGAVLLCTLLPALPAAGAQPRHRHAHKHHQTSAHRAERVRVARARAHRKAVHRAKVLRAERDRAARIRARVLGIPPKRYVVPAGAYFSFPNRSHAESVAIRDRVLLTVRSTWGGRRTALGPLPTNGTIRIATWSFDDWPIAKALYAAAKRGVSVQIVAAKTANADHDSWHWLQRKLGQRLYKRGHPETAAMASFARQCRGACRGYGGTPHSKYFLFDDVGPQHTRGVVVQTSMNLTQMAYQGQWNHAQVMHSARVYDDFARIFAQTRLGRPVASPYHVWVGGGVVDVFFPRPGARPQGDPVMQVLSHVSCTGATHFGTSTGHTRIRIDQYAIYGQRGLWIAKRLRYLWAKGCDIAIIYSISSRPVLDILRSHTGRGPIPMRQSVIKDYWGNLVKYNHSKWLTISGHWGSSTQANVTFTGSANWSESAFGDDEQMQRLFGARTAAAYQADFTKTWRQRSSTLPTYGRVLAFGRLPTDLHLDEPAVAPDFGHGVFRYASAD